MPDVSIQELIRQEATKAGIPPELALSVAEQESSFNPTLINQQSGAIGTFQLMPDTAKQLGVDPNNPIQNIQGGVKYLRQLLDQHNGDLSQVLSTYGGVVHDQAYVPGVLARLPKFAGKPTPAPAKAPSPAPASAASNGGDVLLANLASARRIASGAVRGAVGTVQTLASPIRKAFGMAPATPPPEETTTAGKIGRAAEQVGEFVIPEAGIAKGFEALGLTNLAGRAAKIAAAGKAALRGGAAAGVTKLQGGSDTAAAVNAATGGIGSLVGDATPALAQAIRTRAVNQLAQRFAKGVESTGPEIQHAIKTGEISPQVSDAVKIVRDAASETLDAPVKFGWGKWMTSLGQSLAEKGKTLGTALKSGLGQQYVPKQPVLDALDQLESESVKHFAQISQGGYADVVYNPNLQSQVKTLRQQLDQYGSHLTIQNLVDLKRTWDDAVYTLSTAGKVGVGADVLMSSAEKTAKKVGADAIRAVLDQHAPTVSALDEAVSHAYRLRDLVKKLYKVQPGVGDLGQFALHTGGAGAGVAVGGLVGHPYVGLGLGGAAGRVVSRLFESPLFHTMSPKAKNALAVALANGDADGVRRIVTPLLQSGVTTTSR